VNKVIVVVDLTSSTAMKEQQPEASWLSTYGWFFDLLRDTIDAAQGKIVKYMGDGAMAVFSEDHVAEAINWAIQIQETIASAQANNRVSCDCSIAIAYGEVVEFETPEGGKDYIGTVADRAFRLCSAANAKAIFVDADTVSAASMNRVHSLAGAIPPKRKPADYQGPEQSIKAKGFIHPVAYHEILWGSARYSVSPSFATNLSSQQSAQRPPMTARAVLPSRVARAGGSNPTPPAAAGWLMGRVRTLNERFGFVIVPDGEEFWFNADHLFRRSAVPRLGQDVWFVPADPLPASRNRRATDVVGFGAVLDGVLERVMPQGYGFVLAQSERGEMYQIFLSLGDASGWEAGMRVEFTVGSNAKGIAGYDPQVLDE
jgi:class 3 adenylate cyclase